MLNTAMTVGTRPSGGTTIGSGIITSIGTTAGSGTSLETQPAYRDPQWYKVTSSYNPFTGESYTAGSYGPDWGAGQTGSFMYYNSPWAGTISTAEGGMTYVPGTIPAYTGAGSPWANQNYGLLTGYVNSMSGIVTSPVYALPSIGLNSGSLYGGGYYTTYSGGSTPYGGSYTTYSGGSYFPSYTGNITYPAVIGNYQGYLPTYYSPPTTSSTGHYPSIIY